MTHGVETAGIGKIRQHSLALSEKDKKFLPLRSKIHNHLDRNDAERVRRFAVKVRNPELAAEYKRLADEIDKVFASHSTPRRLKRFKKKLSDNSELAREIDLAIQTLETTQDPGMKDSKHSAISIVFSSRFLIATAAITLLLSWVNTNGENLLFRVVQEFLTGDALKKGLSDSDTLLLFIQDGTTAFYGNFYFWVNIVALILQAFVASRLLKFGGFGVILLTMPVVALISYTAMAFIPILAIVKVMKIVENSTDYSINNTARNVLWLPASTEMKYKGKPTIDSLFVRIGDGIAALTVLIGVQLLAMSTQSFFILNVVLVLVWIAFAVIVIREHRSLSESSISGQKEKSDIVTMLSGRKTKQ